MRIVCHRGANHIAPENTLEAARLCFERSYDFVELDLRTSADGRLLVLHDTTVDRTTNGSGAVADMRWDELAKLDAGSWFGAGHSAERLPLLGDMLGLARETGGGLYIELKGVEPASMLREVVAAGMMERCFFGSENPQAMREVRALAPQAILMARRRDFSTFQQAVEDTGAQIIEFDQTVDDLTGLSKCAEFGVQSMIYDRTHEVQGMEALAALGPDLVNVDRPDIAAEVRDRLAASQPGPK